MSYVIAAHAICVDVKTAACLMQLHKRCRSAEDSIWHCRYYMMYAVSPFERDMNEAGGSLALAVIKYVIISIDLQSCVA